MPKIRFGSTEPDHAPESDTEDTVPYTRDEGTDSDGSDDNAPPEAFTLQDGKQSVEVHDVALHDFQLECILLLIFPSME